jgi:hypothetical protein
MSAVGTWNWVHQGMTKVAIEAEAKFDDAIYRMRTGDKRTAAQLWEELTIAQEEQGDGLVSALKCTSLLNQLVQRGQVARTW